jgi:hypothetical protein
MKKIYNYIMMTLALAIGSMSLIACGETQDELDTSQMGSSKVVLRTFGPSPVLRGGVLRFIGDNMNKVTGVLLPGTAEITEIEVISNSEIHITVPQDAEVGVVTLNTPNGEIVTKTPLTYSEPVVFSSMSPTSVKPGDVITITGDYLNLMHEVIFTEGVTVTTFESQSRKQLTLRVPVAARSGQVILSDGAETPNWLYSKETLTVAIPTYSKGSTEELKAGSPLVITGENLDWIASVRFQGAEVFKKGSASASATSAKVAAAVVGDEGFTVSADGKTLTVPLPETATAGAVTMVCYSGVEIPAGEVTPIEPTELSVSPVPVKNGKDLTITGKDLDLVESVSFFNAPAAAPIVSATATKIVATVDALAQDGDLTLTLKNGNTLTVAYTTVKPTIMAYDPPALTAGEEVTITGTDLDLVTAIIFLGDGTPTVTLTDDNRIDETTLKITVPSVAETCAPQLTLINGVTVDTDVTLDIAPATDPAVATITPNAVTPGSMITIAGKNLNYVESFWFGDTKVSYYEERTATSVTLQVPVATPFADYNIKMVTYAGQEFKSAVSVKVQSPEITILEGPQNMGSWNNQPRIYRTVSGGGLVDFASLGLKVGSKLIFYISSSAWYQIQVCDPAWSTGIFGTIRPDAESVDGIPAEIGTNTRYEIDINEARLNVLLNVQDGWSDTALVLQGEVATVEKVAILP